MCHVSPEFSKATGTIDAHLPTPTRPGRKVLEEEEVVVVVLKKACSYRSEEPSGMRHVKMYYCPCLPVHNREDKNRFISGDL